MLMTDNSTGGPMRHRSRAFAVLAAMALVAIAGGACRTTDLAFRVDERVEITHPEPRSEVTLPFTLTWTVEDFTVTGPDGSDTGDRGWFAVLVDTTPMPPGEGLDYFARDDDSCMSLPGCPDETYLADRNVYLTQETSFEVTSLVDTRPVDRQSAPDDHEIAIVLLDGQSERIGESSFRVEFTVDREPVL